MAVFSNLAGHECISLTTFRRNGEGVPTPVWFAETGGRLVVLTEGTSGKAKRIRGNGAVTVAPCTMSGDLLGPAVDAEARILPRQEEQSAIDALNLKYGWRKRLFDLSVMLQRRMRRRIYLEIVPR